MSDGWPVRASARASRYATKSAARSCRDAISITWMPRADTTGRGSRSITRGRRGRELDAVAVHHEHERRAVLAGGDASVERLARHPAGVTAMADDGRVRALPRPQAERLAHGHRHDGAEAAGTQFGAAGDIRHVPGDVEAAPEGVNHPRLRQEPESRERGVVADARMAVLDGEVARLVVHEPQRHEQRRDEFEASAQVIDVARPSE